MTEAEELATQVKPERRKAINIVNVDQFDPIELIEFAGLCLICGAARVSGCCEHGEEE